MSSSLERSRERISPFISLNHESSSLSTKAASSSSTLTMPRERSSSYRLPTAVRGAINTGKNSWKRGIPGFLYNVPIVHIQHALTFADYHSLCNFQVTSKDGNLLGADEKLWKYLLCHRFCLIPENVEKEKEKNLRTAKEGWKKAHTERIEKLKILIKNNKDNLQHTTKRVVNSSQSLWQSVIHIPSILQMRRLRDQRVQLTRALSLHEQILTKPYFQREYFKKEFVKKEGRPSHVVGSVKLIGRGIKNNSSLKTIKKAVQNTSHALDVSWEIRSCKLYITDKKGSYCKEFEYVSILDAALDGEGGIHFLTNGGEIYYCERSDAIPIRIHQGFYGHTPYASLSVYPDFYIVADNDVIQIEDTTRIPEIPIKIVRRGVETVERDGHKFCYNEEFLSLPSKRGIVKNPGPCIYTERKRFTIDARLSNRSKICWEAEIEFLSIRDFWEKTAKNTHLFSASVESNGFRGLQHAESVFLAKCLKEQYVREYLLTIDEAFITSYDMWGILSSDSKTRLRCPFAIKIADDESSTYEIEPPRFFKDKLPLGEIQRIKPEKEHSSIFKNGLEKFKVKTSVSSECYQILPPLKSDHITNAIQLFLAATLYRGKKEKFT